MRWRCAEQREGGRIRGSEGEGSAVCVAHGCVCSRVCACVKDRYFLPPPSWFQTKFKQTKMPLTMCSEMRAMCSEGDRSSSSSPAASTSSWLSRSRLLPSPVGEALRADGAATLRLDGICGQSLSVPATRSGVACQVGIRAQGGHRVDWRSVGPSRLPAGFDRRHPLRDKHVVARPLTRSGRRAATHLLSLVLLICTPFLQAKKMFIESPRCLVGLDG